MSVKQRRWFHVAVRLRRSGSQGSLGSPWGQESVRNVGNTVSPRAHQCFLVSLRGGKFANNRIVILWAASNYMSPGSPGGTEAWKISGNIGNYPPRASQGSLRSHFGSSSQCWLIGLAPWAWAGVSTQFWFERASRQTSCAVFWPSASRHIHVVWLLWRMADSNEKATELQSKQRFNADPEPQQANSRPCSPVANRSLNHQLSTASRDKTGYCQAKDRRAALHLHLQRSNQWWHRTARHLAFQSLNEALPPLQAQTNTRRQHLCNMATKETRSAAPVRIGNYCSSHRRGGNHSPCRIYRCEGTVPWTTRCETTASSATTKRGLPHRHRTIYQLGKGVFSRNPKLARNVNHTTGVNHCKGQQRNHRNHSPGEHFDSASSCSDGGRDQNCQRCPCPDRSRGTICHHCEHRQRDQKQFDSGHASVARGSKPNTRPMLRQGLGPDGIVGVQRSSDNCKATSQSISWLEWLFRKGNGRHQDSIMAIQVVVQRALRDASYKNKPITTVDGKSTAG